MFATALWHHPLMPLQWGVVMVAALVGAGTDIKSRRIPNWLTGPVLLSGLVFAGVTAGWAGLGDALAGMLLAGVPFVVLFMVECVERGELSHDSTRALVKHYCQPLLDEGADSIVLGCTHYPFLKPLIQEAVGDGVVLIDTGAAVANQLKSRLFEQGLLAASNQMASVNFWSNSVSANPEKVITQLWDESVKVANF